MWPTQTLAANRAMAVLRGPSQATSSYGMISSFSSEHSSGRHWQPRCGGSPLTWCLACCRNGPGGADDSGAGVGDLHGGCRICRHAALVTRGLASSARTSTMPSWQGDEVIVVNDLSAGRVARLTPTSPAQGERYRCHGAHLRGCGRASGSDLELPRFSGHLVAQIRSPQTVDTLI
jgi:hypothetical protein